MQFKTFRNQPLVVKIITAPVLCLLGTILVCAIAYDGMALVGTTIAEIAGATLPKAAVAQRLDEGLSTAQIRVFRALSWQNAGVPDAKIDALVKTTLKDLDDVVKLPDDLLDRFSLSEAEKEQVTRIRDQLKTYRKSASDTLDLVSDPSLAVTLMVRTDKVYADLLNDVSALDAAQEAASRQLSETATADSARTVNLFLMVTAIFAVVASALTFGITRTIIAPLRAMTQAMGQMAAGNSRISIPFATRRDELGDMAKALAVFHDNALEHEQLRRQHEHDQLRSQEILESEMLTLTEVLEGEISATVGDISLQAERMSEGAAQLAETAQALRDMAQSVFSSIETTSGNIQTVAGATEELEASSQEISSQVSNSSRLSDEARQKVDIASLRVGSLTEATGHIDAVVTLIKSLAGQTRLLALNATIEAARAGEAGKGFAVVAEEVKGLAQQTEDGISRVSAQAHEIGRTTQEAVETVEAVAATIHAIDRIAAEVAASADQQRSATAEIMGSAVQAAGHVSTVADNAQALLRGAELTGGTARKVTELTALVHSDINALQRRLNIILRTSGGGNRRTNERVPVALSFTAIIGGTSFSGHTGDLSPSGALLVVPNPPKLEGGQGTLDLDGMGRIEIQLLVDSPLGFHVRFLSLDSTQKDALRAIAVQAQASDEALITVVRKIADDASAAFTRAVRDGKLSQKDLFCTEYMPVEGTNPQQVLARHTELTDQLLPALLEPPLVANPQIVFCCVTDRNGYIATHNQKYSHPQRPDDRAWNMAHSRNRRIFDDRTGILAARNTKPFLSQTYPRDMGQGHIALLKEIDAPITVNGTHWGTVRLAVKL